MTRKTFISMVAMLVCICAAAQTKADFNLIKARNFYMSGANMAGIRSDSVSISNAVLNGSYIFGDGRRGYEAPRSWSAGVDASTIMHLTKSSFYGNFSFTQTIGYDTYANMSVTPGRYPVDVLEYTKGTKTKQRYAFVGGISTDIAPEWRIGAKVDFAATNYAKLKDLRYTNYALDLTFAPSFQWHRGNLAAGAALMVVRNSETVTAEQVGESNSTYEVFLHEGMMFGVRQAWTGGGVHLKEQGVNGFPIFEVGMGVSGQLSYKGLYAELSYYHSDGKVGEKDAIWYTFPIDEYKAAAYYRLRTGHGVAHTFKMNVSDKTTDLNKSVIEKVTEGGVTIRHNYGSNRIMRKNSLTVAPSWSASKSSLFEANATITYKYDNALGTHQYPYYTVQKVHQLSADMFLNWHFTKAWALRSRVYFGHASVYDVTEKVDAGSIDVSEPYRSPKDYQAWYKHVANPYAGVTLTPRYTFKNNIYIQAFFQAEYRKLSYRISGGLSCGYNF